MIRHFSTGMALAFLATPALAAESGGLTLPPGFHATVVADGVGAARHIAVRPNGDIYISTRRANNAPSNGIIALRLGPDHRAAQTEYFGDVDNGTGLRFDRGALYASSPTSIYRFTFSGDALVPDAPAQLVVDGMPTGGFGNRPLALDGGGNLFVSVGSSGNLCTAPDTPKGRKPVGLNPCPSLAGRSGVWRFSAAANGQRFPTDGEQIATGVRDNDALDVSHGSLYAVVHDRNGTHAGWPELVSEADEDAIAEEMHLISRGTHLGWPYTYYDSRRKVRLVAPEYGGDGKTDVPAGIYATPVATFTAHSSPLDLVFYKAKQFPAKYRGGAFVVLHGGLGPHLAAGRPGYRVEFLPFDRKGRPGTPEIFADGFAGATAESRNADSAVYRPTGAAVGPDGALYVVEGQKGRVWRISYDGRP